MLLTEIKELNIDIGKRISKNENYIFQLILNILEANKESLSIYYNDGIIINKSDINLNEDDIIEALHSLIKREIIISYRRKIILEKIFFSYISSFEIDEENIKIYIPIQLINSFKNDKLEYQLSIRSFFYFRQKIISNFFNFLLNNISNINIDISLDRLKEILEIDTQTYDRFFDFEKFILKPLVEKINAYSIFSLKYEKIKKGESKNTKVIAISFVLENKERIRNKVETNYLIQIVKNEIQDYTKIWNTINSSIKKYSFEITKRNIIFIRENKLKFTDLELIEYLESNAKNIESILKLSNNILIKEKYGIYKNTDIFIKNLYDAIIGYDYYYSLNFKFLNVVKNYKENEHFFYKDNFYIIYGYYSKTKGFFKIFESINN